MLAFSVTWSLFYFTLRKRGYRGNIIALFIAGSCIVGLLGATALILLMDRDPLARIIPAYSKDERWVQMAFGSVGFASCSISIMHILLRLLPVRRPRVVHGGPRKGWFYLARVAIVTAILLWFASLTWLLLLLLMPGRYEDYTVFAVLGFFFSFVYFHFGRGLLKRARASRQISEVLKSDARPPVLYVRAFKDEAVAFDFVPPRKGRSGWGLPDLASDFGSRGLELYITDAVERMIGPLIALGNPDDSFSPVGAARAYLGSADWREEFKALVLRSRAVLVLPGNTRELDWEMGYLLSSGNAGKLFLLFGRWVYGFPENPLDKFFGTSVKRFVWSEFRSAIFEIGYRVPTTPPSPGTVMSFDSMGEFRTISRPCDSPEDYVRAIVDV
ncbi:MAG: hypothetical protein WD696_17615 [Bryobacteraceae bacterium]